MGLDGCFTRYIYLYILNVPYISNGSLFSKILDGKLQVGGANHQPSFFKSMFFMCECVNSYHVCLKNLTGLSAVGNWGCVRA